MNVCSSIIYNYWNLETDVLWMYIHTVLHYSAVKRTCSNVDESQMLPERIQNQGYYHTVWFNLHDIVEKSKQLAVAVDWYVSKTGDIFIVRKFFCIPVIIVITWLYELLKIHWIYIYIFCSVFQYTYSPFSEFSLWMHVHIYIYVCVYAYIYVYSIIAHN